MTSPATPNGRAATGVQGLDHILGGGLPQDRLYLVDGDPGSGKTTLGLQFLMEGIQRGEKVLYVTLSRSAVDRDHASVLVIHSLNGYINAMPEERFLLAPLHELFMFLRQRGVVAIAIVAQHGMIGTMKTPVDPSYLADNVVLLRFFEAAGRVRQAISILKKRTGAHEKTIRELRLEAGRISLGEPLTEFNGVLAGVPTFRRRSRAEWRSKEVGVQHQE